ncbi:MAG: hypothetical protein M1331_01055 [Candidatus Marsarchaeota archaeon]|nr:hypothetical protein [Candidatus Marsarchaeota archaeon]MCL5105972.1 hypothetical protein [Candidatus Marsarchaeota archaeon]
MEKNNKPKKTFDIKYSSLISHLLRIKDEKKLKKVAIRSYYQIIKKYPFFAHDLAEKFSLDADMIKKAELKFEACDDESKIRQYSRFQGFLRMYSHTSDNIPQKINMWLQEQRRRH